jgi:uncharacterized damage-inducible protein DinB
MQKWLAILNAAQAHAGQIPRERLAERATPGRDRSIRDLAYHVYQVPDAFLAAVQDGMEDLSAVYNAPPPADVHTGDDIRRHGAQVEEKMRRWWAGLADKSCAAEVNTYYGPQPLHHLLERCTWHSAQHARQIAVVLQRFGIEPSPPLTAEHYAGLPMPVGLWE